MSRNVCASKVVTYFVERTRSKYIIRKNDDKTRAIVILTCVKLLSLTTQNYDMII